MIQKEIIIKKVFFQNQDTNVFLAATTEGEKISGINNTWLKSNFAGFKFKIKGKISKNNRNEEIIKLNDFILADSNFFIFMKNNIGHFRPNILKEILNENNEEELIAIIENEPETLTKYKYLGTAIVKKIQKKWLEQKKLYELSSALTTLGITDNLVNRIYKYILLKKMYVEDFLEEFKKNPYILTNVELVGFKTADAIALKMGTKKDSKFRIESALLFSFNEIATGKGDTALKLDDLFKTVKELTSQQYLKVEFVKECLDNLVKKEEVFELKDTYFALMKYYKYESFIFDFVTELRAKENDSIVLDIDKFIKENEIKMGIKLSEEQKNAIEMVNEGHSVFALCGYAGTGKSTISKIILNLFKNKNILCTAVSGIATDRIRKATGQNASIMYGLLMNHTNLNDIDVLLIDETSMINTEQFYYLLKKFEYRKNKIKIIFVGDKAQLPPIGPGNFFTDIIENRLVPFVELKTIFRQSKDMILTTFAEKIRNGIVPSGYNTGIYKDFQFITQEVSDFWAKKKRNDPCLMEDKRENRTKTKNLICENYKKNVPKNYQKNINWFDYIYGNQIITPMKRYELGVENINKTLQGMLADQSKSISFGFLKFCLYDKVVQIKNKEIETFDTINIERAKGSIAYKRKIFNGMLGMIVDIDTYSKCFYVVYPIEKIICRYNIKNINVINLGYAVTIHKSQGAEFENVYIPINYAHFIMLNNKLLYTAITRAKKKVTLIGEKGAFAMACKKSEEIKRFSIIEAMLFYNFL